jgi:chaperonin cofactor prefoldin
MKTINMHILALVITGIFTSPAMATEAGHESCNDEALIHVDDMGMINEESLRNHMDKVKEQLQKVRHARGSHLSQRLELKRHLSDMKDAMQEIHNQMYAKGCDVARHGASIDVRVQVIEKHMDMLQQMMEQILEHLSENEK